MDAPGNGRPHLGIASRERVNLVIGQLETLLAQFRQRLERPLHEAKTQFLVRHETADDQLHCLLGHPSRLLVRLQGNVRANVRCRKHLESRRLSTVAGAYP